MRLVLALSINIILLALTFLYFTHLYLAILIGTSLFIWFFWFLWRRQNLVMQRVEEKIKGHKVILPVEHIMFRAIESSGYSQTSGMGYIALTDEELYFELALLDLAVSVPIGNLRGAEFVRRLKGVSPLRQMLRIMYVDEQGEPDSIAIQVKDMDGWKRAIEGICKRG